jgi:predicted secreted protein
MNRRFLALSLVLALALVAGSLTTSAQEEPSGGSEPSATDAAPDGAPPTAPPPRDAPYEDRLVRLAEIVGSVHYLETLCSAGESAGAEAENETLAEEGDGNGASAPVQTSDWRRMMGALIETEAPEPDRNAKLTAAFNRGYRSFASVYTRCTDAARTATERYRSEGATLATEIIARFGN